MTKVGADILAPARAPQGRFHHSGQTAIYTSMTIEGTIVAMQRYRQADGGDHVVVPLTVHITQLADQRGNPKASIVWQEICASGRPSPTWAFSDAARAAGAQGLLYSSRSRPDLTHLVIFDPDVILGGGKAILLPSG